MLNKKVRELHERIMDLEQALFFNMSTSVLKLPASMIKALHVDETGQIWFLIHRPPQHINEFERAFPARLDFFKKGKEYYLRITGSTRLITDPEEMNEAGELYPGIVQPADGQMVLAKLRIRQFSYYPLRVHETIHIPVKEAGRHIVRPLAFFKPLQNIVKNIIPVLQSH